MKVIKIAGGLGNQMFQYAFARSVENRGERVYIDVKYFELPNTKEWLLGIFPKVKINYCMKLLQSKIVERIVECFGAKICEEEMFNRIYNEEFYNKKYVYIQGYFQSPKYFWAIEEQIREEFMFPIKRDNKLLKMIEYVQNCESVAIHIRRGDYLQFSEIYGGVCTQEYYRNAIQIIKERVKNPVFIFFSDDIEWVKQNFHNEGAVYVDASFYETVEDWKDMCVMSNCKHNIIANSSYSWWGAFLNQNLEKCVIMPKKWDSGGTAKELILNGWICI